MKLKFLNIGCGNKTHPDWINADFNPNRPDILNIDIKKKLPFEDSSLKVVYHSQVLEHLTKEEGAFFINECYRILEPGGILRVVVPDLENIVREYLRLLELSRADNSNENMENYHWILLELFDQVSRNKSTGEMGKYLSRTDLRNQDYLISRLGYTAKSFFNHEEKKPKKLNNWVWLKIKLYRFYQSFFSSKVQEIGEFRLSGEVHYWMYDSFSLKNLLIKSGFLKAEVVDPHKSTIANWETFQLDVQGDFIMDPSSLFIEAYK